MRRRPLLWPLAEFSTPPSPRPTQLICTLLDPSPVARDAPILLRGGGRPDKLVALYPESADGKAGVDKVALRKQEALTGDYNWASAFQQSLADPHVDIANYVSPNLAIKESPDKERTLFAAGPIKAGSLLMVQKPLVSSYHNKVLKDNRSVLSVNLFNETVERTTQVDLKRRLTARLMDDPSLAACVDRRYAGPQYPIPSVFDLSDLQPKEDVDTTSPVPIDSSMLEGVRTFNSFWPQRIVATYKACLDGDNPPPILTSKIDESPSALYLLPSLINHSCTADACALPILRPLPSARCDALTIVRAPTDPTRSWATPSLLERVRPGGRRKYVTTFGQIRSAPF